jgi:hypothetical protein
MVITDKLMVLKNGVMPKEVFMKSIAIWYLILFSTVVGVTKSNAQKDEKVVRAVRIEPNEAPKIDGKLDDECWKKAGKAADFIQFEPILGEKPKEPTIVYLLYDKEKLYVGFECFKNDTSQIVGSQTKRDSDFFRDDFVEIFLDTYHDHRNCYSFAINCIDAQVDRRIANEGSISGGDPMWDPSRAWDCAWEAKTAKTDKGWTAEMAIPFSELRFNKKGDGTWGINFWRGNQEFNERDTWTDVGDRQLNVSRFGRLEDLTVKDLVVARRLELKPYAIIKPQINPEREIEPDAGIDVRYPSSTITADFTFNPDFGQIEADPERINLGDVEERLTEKRPFFQEGMELFQTPIELFYTRRVGITDLMYGAKAVGKLSGFNFALVDCQSNDTKECDETTKDETKNNYLVFRTQTDIGANSSIGIIGVNKQKADGYNRAGGIDCNITLPYEMRLIGQFTRSWFPDKNDNATIFSLKREAKGLFFEAQGGDIGRNFDVESGYIPRIDCRGGRISTDYGYKRDAKIFKEIHAGVSYERLENHDGIKTNESRRFGFGVGIADFFVMAEPEWYQHTDDFDVNIVYTNRTIFFFTGFSPPKWISIMSPIMIGKQENKRSFFIGPGLTITPLQKFKFEVGIDRFDREGESLMLNRRFSVGYQISQKMALRGNLELTRDGKKYIFALFSWEFRPESNLFLVYIDSKEEGKLERIILFKMAYLFGLKFF